VRLAALATLLALLLVCALPAGAERVKSFGPYQVHYNAFSSGFLSPEVARDYGILRSRTRGVLVVSVHEEGRPVRARVQAQTVDGSDNTRITMREVRTNGEPLYVGSFKVDDGQNLRFDIAVAPEGGGEPLAVRFQQQFFAD